RRHTRFSRDWSSDVCSSDLVVVYETHFGQTGKVAAEIATGARDAGAAAAAVAVDHITRDKVDGADLLVVGGPTHVRGMSRPWSRSAERRVGRGTWRAAPHSW